MIMVRQVWLTERVDRGYRCRCQGREGHDAVVLVVVVLVVVVGGGGDGGVVGGGVGDELSLRVAVGLD